MIEKMIVGWVEWVSLPELGIPAIKAKIDTGATTSSIHAYDIEYFTKDGEEYVNFELHPLQKNRKISKRCHAKVLEKRMVKSSNGRGQLRPVVLTTMKIGNVSCKIELNLTNRDAMGMRMLVGREALSLMLVNPNHKFLHGRKLSQSVSKIYEEMK